MVPFRRADAIASAATSAVDSPSAAKMPPQWNQRAPSPPKIASQSTSPGRSWLAAVLTPVGAADGAADAEATLREVEPVAHLAADAVVRDPADVRLVDAALEHQVLDEPADGVVGERGDDRRAQPEAAAQAAGDVVLAAALPDLETSAWWRCAPRRDRGAA